MKTNLTRGKKLFYSFLLAGCFITVAAMDDGAEQEEVSQAHAEWIAEQTAKQIELERQNKPHPQAIGEPAFAGQPSLDAQYAALRDRWEERKKGKMQ